MNQEHEATNYYTMRHIELVRKLLNRCIRELLTRGELHDQSKLASPEVEAFTEYTPKLAALTYGSPEYEGFREAMRPALEHHYANNRHHPEFFRRDEEWRPVVDFEDYYEVSSYGDIRSLDREVYRVTGSFTKKGKLLTANITPKGYCRIQLTAPGVKRSMFVHRIVAEAFIPNPDLKPEVNHKDGDKRNNFVGNLEWATESENQKHAYDTGLKEASVKYAVTCVDLDITTLGCEKMEVELKKLGYGDARAASIWRCAVHGGKHLDLEFVALKFEKWMNSPINDMNLIDVVEMLCDWKAASARHNDGNLRKSIEINAKRFGIDSQLVRILENTADLLEL